MISLFKDKVDGQLIPYEEEEMNELIRNGADCSKALFELI